MIELKLTELKIWFDEKALLIERYFQDISKPKITCAMGEIYFAKMGINVGYEIDKYRPVVVFQGTDYYIKNSNMVFIFPITTNLDKKKYKVFFNNSDFLSGNIREGGILIQQGRSISKTRLVKRLGKMKKSKLLAIKAEFEKLLYKNTPLQSED